MNSYPQNLTIPGISETYRFSLPWPPSVNTYWRHVVTKGKPRTLISKKGREYRKDVCNAILMQKAKPKAVVHDRLAVLITAFPPDRRKRDLDNLPKAVLDALTFGQVWGDDSQIDDLRIVRGEIEKGGRIEIQVARIEG